MRSFAIVLASGALLSGCPTADPVEGIDFPCDNGLDDDGNGYFDCQDRGCWASPACEDVSHTDQGGTDTDGKNPKDPKDTDGSTDTDTTVNPGVISGPTSNLKSASLRYHVKFEATGAAHGILTLLRNNGIDLHDCEASYIGSGELVAAEFNENTYQGTFTQADTSCDAITGVTDFPQLNGVALDTGSVYQSGSGDAFHTFLFKDNLSRITHWVEHEYQADSTPTLTPYDDAQYWIRFTEPHSYDSTAMTMSYFEVEIITIEGLLPYKITSTYEVKFSETDTPPAMEAYPVEPYVPPVVDTDNP